jgi:hypothetical protein
MSNKPAQKAKRGRPPNEYSAAVLDVLATTPEPYTITQMCETLGIRNHTFYKWFKEEAEFTAAVTRMRESADDQVVNALHRRALGYTYTEVTDRTESGPDGEKFVQTVTPKHLPPDPGAAMNWLKNRAPGDWREKITVEVDVDHVALLERAKKALQNGQG